MRIFIIIIGLLLFLSCDHKTSVTSSDKDIKELTHLKEVLWPKAYREQDAALLNLILGDDFQMIDAAGNWSDKEFEMDWIQDNIPGYDSFRYEIKRLEFFSPDNAIVAGTGHIYTDTVYTIYQSSNVLTKRSGSWKAIASHVSGIKTAGE